MIEKSEVHFIIDWLFIERLEKIDFDANQKVPIAYFSRGWSEREREKEIWTQGWEEHNC